MKCLMPVILIVATIFADGCSGSAFYKRDYLDQELKNAPDGVNCRAIIYTTETDDKFVYKGHPSSGIGFAIEIELPIGILTRNVAEYTFQQACLGGALISKDLINLSGDELVIYPKITGFDYRYKDLGLSVTIQVRVILDVAIVDVGGHVGYKGRYDSGYVDSDKAVFHFRPYETVNKVSHKVIYQLMKKAAADIINKKSIEGGGLW